MSSGSNPGGLVMVVLHALIGATGRRKALTSWAGLWQSLSTDRLACALHQGLIGDRFHHNAPAQHICDAHQTTPACEELIETLFGLTRASSAACLYGWAQASFVECMRPPPTPKRQPRSIQLPCGAPFMTPTKLPPAHAVPNWGMYGCVCLC